MIDNRLTSRLADHWQRQKKDAPLPSMKKFNSSQILDLWPRCLAIEIVSQPKSDIVFKYSHVGDQLVSMLGTDITGTIQSAKSGEFPGSRLFRRLDKLVEEAKMVEDEHQFVTPHHKMIKYRACFLPYGEGEKVTHVICGISWREFNT